MAEALGRTPPASTYSPDMSVHVSQIEGETHRHETSLWKKAFLLDLAYLKQTILPRMSQLYSCLYKRNI